MEPKSEVDKMKNIIAKQRGMTFLGLVFVLGIIAILVLFVLRAFPLYYERTQVLAAMQSVAHNEGSKKYTEREAQREFMKSISITNIERFGDRTIKNYLTLEKPKDGGPKILHMKYNATNELAAGLYLLLKVDLKVPLTTAGTGEN